MDQYISQHKIGYNRQYEKGYGVRYPDSFLVTLYYRFVRPTWSKYADTEYIPKVLDFGCGNGVISHIFADDHKEVYGIDISESAIDLCKKDPLLNPSHYAVVDLIHENMKLKDIFHVEFDLILCPGVLLHFSNTHLNQLLSLFNDGLRKDGMFMANMYSFNTEPYSPYKHAERKDGLIAVDGVGSLDERLFVNIVNDKDEVVDMFSIFSPVKCVRNIIELEQENEYFWFIGKKR